MRLIYNEGEPVPKKKQERCTELDNFEHRLNITKAGCLQSIQNSLNDMKPSCNVENYFSVLAETDAKLIALRQYRWHLENDRADELT